MEKVSFELLIRTKTRTHISSATGGTYDPKNGWTYRYKFKRSGLFPLTLTKTVPVVLAFDDSGMETHHVPVLPATTFRGILRRHSASLVQDALLKKGEKISHDVYQAMHCGAVRRAPSGELQAWEDMAQVMDHVFFGLYGGGSRMTPSKLTARDAYPTLDILVTHQIIPRPNDERWILPTKGPEALRSLLAVDQVVRRDDLLLGVDPQAPAVIDNYAEAYAELVGDTMTRRRTRDAEQDDNEEESTDRATLSTLAFVEYIPPGVPFHVHFTLRNPNDAQVGFFFKTLMSFVDNGQIGAKKALGMGEFTCLAANLRIDKNEPQPLMTNIDGVPLWSSDAMSDFVAKADEALEKLDAANLEAVVG